MLQEPGDGFDVKKYVSKLTSLEEDARRLSRSLVGFLSSSQSTRLIVAYSGHGYLPASCMFWHTVTMDEEKSILLLDASSTALYILAYRDPTPIVAYAPAPSASFLNMLQVARVMGHPYAAFTGKPSGGREAEVLEGYGLLYTASQGELDSSLAMSIAVYHALAELYGGRLAKRGARILGHSREGFTPVVEGLIEAYGDAVSWMLSHRSLTVTSGRLLESSSLYLVEALRRRGVDARYEHPEMLRGPGDALVAGTGVEEYYLRELKHRFSSTGIVVRELVVNTDPVEANIYLAILANYIASTHLDH
nr:hypothetical protein [Desulfurococcus mucosus]